MIGNGEKVKMDIWSEPSYKTIEQIEKDWNPVDGMFGRRGSPGQPGAGVVVSHRLYHGGDDPSQDAKHPCQTHGGKPPLAWVGEHDPGSIAYNVSFQVCTGQVAICVRVRGQDVIDCQDVADEP